MLRTYFNIVYNYTYMLIIAWKIYLFGKVMANFAEALPHHNCNHVQMLHEETDGLVTNWLQYVIN